MTKILNAASVLLLVVSLAAVITGLYDLFTKTGWEGQLAGLYLSGCGMFFTPLILIPFRKGEKWAWYTTLVAGGIALLGQMVLVYMAGSALAEFYLPASAVLIILWIAGLLLPVKKFFS
jgi:ABC-type glycerol-3-phosphate transport system permease component